MPQKLRSLIKPDRLLPGDVVGIAAPASPPPDPKAVDRAVEQVERLGFRPRLGRHIRDRHGYLAGSDRDRASDVMALFTDCNVKGVICLRGGYGTSRLLQRLDYAAIRRNPKVFAGYSDITALHCALSVKAGLVSFHSPMLNEGLGSRTFPASSERAFLNVVSRSGVVESIRAGQPRAGRVDIVRGGVALGRLVGGNLSVLVTTVGTPYQPRFRNRILFFGDIGEAPYRLDRMLTHLWNAGLLQQLAGVAVGATRDCEDRAARRGGEYRQSAAEVIRERLRPLGVPVVVGLPFGHQPLNVTIPIGVRARLDGDAGELQITESAVR